MSHLIQKEVQALLLDARGRIPAVLIDDSVIGNAVPIRDKPGIDHALVYLSNKETRTDGAKQLFNPDRY